MSPTKFALPQYLQLKSSRQITAFIVFIHTMAIVVVMLLPLSFAWLILLTLPIMGSMVLELNRQGSIVVGRFNRLWRYQPVTAIKWQSSDLWQITLGEQGKHYSAILLPTSVIHPSILVLQFRLTDIHKRWALKTVLLVQGNIVVGDLRRLRVHLLLARVKPVDDSAA